MHIKNNKFQKFFVVIIIIANGFVFQKQASAMVVSDPVLAGIATSIKTNSLYQLLEMQKTVAEAINQTRLFTEMVEALADGEVTAEMFEYAFDMAKKCGFESPEMLLDLGLDFDICKEGTLGITSKIEAGYSVDAGSFGQNESKKAESLNNLAKMQKKVYEHSLAMGAGTQKLNTTEALDGWRQQLKSDQSLVNQAYVTNSIEMANHTELVEIRKLLALLVWQNGILLADFEKFEEIK